MKILVAGGSGFVGSHLVPELLARGHEVRIMTRTPRDREDGAHEAFGDVADAKSVAQAMAGMDTGYYLVHTLDRADFVERDRRGATAFAEQAKASGLSRIVYLGGLGDERDALSDHLRSRREVEMILSRSVPTVALRAGIVVGDGSVSWEILCQLVERLPLMVTPRWVQTKTQPIALADVVQYLVSAMEIPDITGHFDIGAPEAMTYKDMLEATAAEMNRSLHILPVPLLSPRLSSHWLRLITDIDLQTARTLVDSMTNEVVVTERRMEELSGHRPMSFVDGMRIALRARGASPKDEAPTDVAS